jgi:hypothetical protein
MPGMPILTMDFVPVSEPKTAKNRIHWDVTVPDVAPLVEARATLLRAGRRHPPARAGRPGGKRVLCVHRVTTATGLRRAPGRLLALALLPQIPAGPLSRQHAQRPRSTSRSWGTGLVVM